MSQRLVTVMALLAAPFVFAAEAAASELIARKATSVKLEVSRDGSQALLSYKTNGRSWYVLAGGAIDARQPARGGRQVSFRLRRSTTRPPFAGSCTRTHPAVPELDVACAAGRTS